MLTTAQQASEYRSVASAVTTWLIDLQLEVAAPPEVDFSTQGRITTVQQMLAVGQFAAGPDELDTYGSSQDKLDLARELVGYVPERVRASRTFNMRDWSNRALVVLEAVKNGASWEDLAAHHDFIEVELIPLLRTVASLPPDEPEW